MAGVRDRFFEGELPGPLAPHQPRSRISQKGPLTAEDMMNRIDNRLRRIVVKACSNSYAASKVVETFEEFLVASFADSKPKLVEDWWDDLLLEPPSITSRKDLRSVAQFFFDADSTTGGFHRLLLHAVCQFHGLHAVSKMVDITIDSKSKSRALNVTGVLGEKKFRLLDHIAERQNDTEAQERLSALAL